MNKSMIPEDPNSQFTKNTSFNHSTSHQTLNSSDRRYAYSRQSSFQQQFSPRTPMTMISNNNSMMPGFSRSVSSIDIPPARNEDDYHLWKDSAKSEENLSSIELISSVFRALRSGNRPMKRLFLLISLNVAYSTAELFIGLLSGRVGLVSDAFHLTFGCGLLTFSLFAMATSRRKADRVYTYGYKRLEVLSAFTNALFLLFMSFSLAVEALHAYIQDESEHKHYLIVSAVTNLLVNLVGVWFFRNYARRNLAYRNAEDMNYHSVCLHVIADSIRSAGLILASWLLALGIQNAEVLCMGLVSVAVFMLVMPLFKATGGVLLQMAPPSIPSSAMSKCSRQIAALEDVTEIYASRFWELVPGYLVGSLSLQLKAGADDRSIRQFVHGLYHDLGVQDLTLQTDYV
ncbi:metal tolerance protein C2 [Beta vulgaris subsp. vulgaris]|uniref:metal tolerance protein C2 n=1 Tax=Beta vulgaris subsp. vulgaris TaxID=3555 RepID=UPI002036FB7D|nr:metal tolerance protein C2 [Beta vulgaris subsp. vulgaris]